jgi:hypothetical protein
MAKEDKPTADVPQDGKTPVKDSPKPVDDTYKDKSLDDVIEMHKELKSHSDSQFETLKGDKDKEMDTLKKDLLPYKSWYEEQQRTPAPASQPTVDPEVEKTKAVDELLSDPEAWYQKRKMKEQYQEAFNDGPLVFARVKKENPAIFEGIDDNAIMQNVLGGIRQGVIRPDMAMKPETWKMAAWQAKGVETDFSITPSSPTPTSPPAGDLPPGVKPQVGDKEEDDIDFANPLIEDLRIAWSEDGKKMSKEKATEMIKRQRENPDPRMSLEIKKE